MPRVLLCVFVVAVARCMAAAHYKDGEKVRGYVTRMRGENVTKFLSSPPSHSDHSVREQSGAVLQPAGDVPLLLSSCVPA